MESKTFAAKWESIGKDLFWGSEPERCLNHLREPVSMDHNEFWRRYREAKQESLRLASSVILEQLPALHLPFIRLPMREPSSDLSFYERVFERDDVFRRSGHGHPHEEEGMVDYFWRDGFVPRWIDISVFSTNGTITVLELCASDVFTRYEANGCPFYTERRFKPWAAKSPLLPLGWRNAKESGRFSLNWHLKGTRGQND